MVNWDTKLMSAVSDLEVNLEEQTGKLGVLNINVVMNLLQSLLLDQRLFLLIQPLRLTLMMKDIRALLEKQQLSQL